MDGSSIYKYPISSSKDANPYQVEHDRLFASIREGGVINDTFNGAKSTLAAIMGRMATYTGKKITWEEIMNSKENLVPDDLDWNSSPPTLPNGDGRYEVPKPGVTKFI